VTDENFFKELIARGPVADEGYFHFAHLAAVMLPQRLHEQLRQLINGPVYDGDVISKQDRDDLLRLGLAIRVCCKGQQGHTGATYFAFSVMKIADEIKAGKIAA